MISGSGGWGRRVLVGLLVLQGLGGLGGGIYMVSDPSGGMIGLPLEWLEGSLFPDYLVPGLTLVTILGLFPLAVALALVKGWSWGVIGSIAVGGALIIWMLVEILVVGYQSEPPLQVVFGSVGVAIVGLGTALLRR